MRSARATWLLAIALGGCGSAPAHSPAATPTRSGEEESPEPADTFVPPPASSAASSEAPERSRPPSTASYEQATSQPEPVNLDDHRIQLTDAQLREPMNGVLNACRIPANAKVTIKAAVQFGRAIGVTVVVSFEHPAKPTKRVSRAAAAATARSEAKAKKRVAACIDHAVRAVVWPPSTRRDSVTTAG